MNEGDTSYALRGRLLEDACPIGTSLAQFDVLFIFESTHLYCLWMFNYYWPIY